MATTEEFKNGGSTSYSFSIEYIKASDIKVKIDGAAQTYTTNASPSSGQYKVVSTTVTLGAAAASGTGNVHIYRETDLDTAGATFVAGSSIRAADLNAIHDLTRLASQEQNQIVTTEDIRDSAVTSAKIDDGTIVNADINASAAIAGTKVNPNFGSQAVSTSGTLASGATTVTGNISVSGTVDGRDVAADGSKLDGIEAGATGNQTNAEIRTAVEAASDSNVFTDADHSKLNAIEPSATADQTDAEIRTAVENATDSNVFTDADHSKLNAIEASATADQTASEIRTLVESASDSNVFTDADHTKLNAAATVTGSETLTNKTLTSPVINDMSGTAVVTSGTSTSDTKTYSAKRAGEIFYGKDTVGEIQSGETWSAADDKVATTSAIDARIIDLVDDVGGFVPIANETSFPNANPDVNNGAGTLVSIKALASNLTSNGSGVATIANGTVGNSTVTITGLANSTTYASTYGMIVETTTTLNTYTFHRQVPKATEVTTVSGSISNVNTVAGAISNVNAVAGNATNINTVAGSDSDVTSVAGSISNVNSVASNLSTVNDFAARYRTGANNPTSSLDTGDLFFNTSANELKVYNGSAWQGGVTASGNFASTTGNTWTGDNLYNDGVKAKFGTGSDLQIYHSGSDSWIKNTTGVLVFGGPDIQLANVAGNEQYIRAVENGAVNLYYDNSKKLDTASGGINVVGYVNVQSGGHVYLGDNGKLMLGDQSDLQIYHDGTHTDIKNGQGNLHIRNDGETNIQNNGGSENRIKTANNGAVELYYDNSLKLETTSYGVFVTGTFRADVIDMQDNKKSNWGNDDDLEIYHSGTNTFFENTTGNVYFRNDGSATYFQMGSGNEDGIAIAKDDGVFLYFDGAQKFQTTSTGAKVNGAKLEVINTAGAGDSQLYLEAGEGGTAFIQFIADNGDDNTDKSRILQADGANLKIQNYDSGSWATKFETDTNGVTITGQCAVTSHVAWPDHSSGYVGKAVFGNGDDLQLFHDGGNSWVKEVGTGALYIDTDGAAVKITQGGASENMAVFNKDGAVELYYNNFKMIETTASGGKVNGTLQVTSHVKLGDSDVFVAGDGDDFQLYHDGSNSWIKNLTGVLVAATADFQVASVAGDEQMIRAYDDGAVQLYFDNSLKLTTSSTGVEVSGNVHVNDSDNLQCGNSADLKIYHDGTHSNIINDTGNLYINASASDTSIACKPDGAVELYYDNSKKFATTSGGVHIYSALNTSGAIGIGNSADLTFEDNGKAKFGFGADFQIYHNGNHSMIINSTGNTFIQGGGGTIYLQAVTDENAVKIYPNAQVELYYDGSKKFETTSSGVTVTGALTSDNTCKAYINLNQGINLIRLAYNVASITDNGTGQHRITFTTALSNAYYSVATGGAREQPESSRCHPTNVDNINTTYFDITNHNDGSSNVDWELCCCIVHGL